MTALAQTTVFEDAYVAMDPSDGRDIFSGVQTYKADGSVDKIGEFPLASINVFPTLGR